MRESNEMHDALHFAMEKAREHFSGMGMFGFGVAHLLGPDGKTKELVPFWNIITNRGDTYYATRGAAGVSPATPADETTKVSRMKLGTGTTAANKSAGTNEVIQTYISGSVLAFDTSYPSITSASANSGAVVTYKTTWAAGTATNSAITEATITTATADSQGAASDTISRTTFTAINKTASDSLAITLTHTFKGA